MTHTFDISHESTITDFFSFLEKYNLSLDSFIINGPAGGNPEITVSGNSENIQKMISEI